MWRERAVNDYYDSNAPQVFHRCENCSVGSQIPQAQIKTGTPPGAVLCAECTMRLNNNDCMSRVPAAR